MPGLIECIPNFSEGRRADVITALVASIRDAAPVHILNVSSDPDHNRTVVTFVGEAAAVEAAAFNAIRTAALLIDLDTHSGEHPRLGATDVVPFVPLDGATIAECVVLAHQLAQRVGTELGLPVYLYEEAALRTDRRRLEDIRRGEYEALKTQIGINPDRQPDFGPAQIGTAGAVVIGARHPLIAFNVTLNTGDVTIARRIAQAIRESSGGLQNVKANGFLVEGQAQVSMNLTDFARTPIYRVVELIRVEAARYGVQVSFSELVGLIPEAALIDSARWYLQLDRFESTQILERSIRAAFAADQVTSPTPAAIISAVAGFVDQVAAPTPTPGGGPVTALAGALGAALAAMVAQLTIGRKKYAAVDSEMREIVAQAARLQARLLAAMPADMAAYDDVIRTFRLEKDDPTREAQVQAALITAADVPLEVMRLAVEVLGLAQTAAALGNTNVITDAAAGSYMAIAAIEGAALNVRINAKSMTDPILADRYRSEAAALIESARRTQAAIVAEVEARTGLQPLLAADQGTLLA